MAISVTERDKEKAAAILKKNGMPTQFTDRDRATRNGMLRDDIAAALAGAREAWLPIETAPKDKRKVLLFHAADDDGDCYKIAYWSNLAARPGWFYRGGWLEESEPDGWMPLPDPPEVKD